MKKIRVLSITFLILSFVGFLDAAFLTVEHFLKAIPPCAIVSGCSTVLTSQWSTVFGIPVSLLGAIDYLILFGLTVAALSTGNVKLQRLAAKVSVVGFLASAWLVYLQFFVIHEICLYCMVSAIISTAIFAVGISCIIMSKNTAAVISPEEQG